MTGLARKTFLSILLLTLTATCLGQASRRREAATTRGKSSPVRVEREVILTSPDETREVGEATVSYSPEDDRTLVSTKLNLEDLQSHASLWLEVGFVVKGKTVSRPETVKFRLSNSDERFRFGLGYALKVKTDGGPLDLTRVERHRLRSDIGVENEMTGQMAFAEFEKFANSDDPKVLVGPYVFEMGEIGRRSLRDLLRTIESPSK